MANLRFLSYGWLQHAEQLVRLYIQWLRLQWHLFASISTSVHVIDDPTNPNSAKQPYQNLPSNTDKNNTISLHPISNCSNHQYLLSP